MPKKALSEQELWAQAVREELRKKGIKNSTAAESIGIDYNHISRFLKKGRKKDDIRDKYSETLGRLCGISPEAFDYPRSGIYHLNYETWNACKKIGDTRTLWVSVHFNENGSRFEWDAVSCAFNAKRYRLPPDYDAAYQEALASLGPTEDNRHRECLVSATRFERGNTNQDCLQLVFGYSDYASKRAIMSSDKGRSLAHQALSQWSPGAELIPHLNVGVGCHVCIVTNDFRIPFARRKNRLRHRQWDVGAVEGLSPFLDEPWAIADSSGKSDETTWEAVPAQNFALRNLFLRALREEFHISEDMIEELNCFGIGYDMYYSQWNFIGSAYLKLSYSELERLWPRAQARDENFPAEPCELEIASIEQKIEGEIFWSSGVACLLYSLRWHYANKLRKAFPYDLTSGTRRFRMKNEEQYFLHR